MDCGLLSFDVICQIAAKSKGTYDFVITYLHFLDNLRWIYYSAMNLSEENNFSNGLLYVGFNQDQGELK